MKVYSFETQLAWLSMELAKCASREGLADQERAKMVLSLAESVKAARRHALDCSPTQAGEDGARAVC